MFQVTERSFQKKVSKIHHVKEREGRDAGAADAPQVLSAGPALASEWTNLGPTFRYDERKFQKTLKGRPKQTHIREVSRGRSIQSCSR